MENLNRILIANDSQDGLRNALAKAALIEQGTGAEVEVAEIIWNQIEEEALHDTTKADLISQLVDTEQRNLDRLLTPYCERIAWSEARVIWNKDACDGIVDEVSLVHADLLIKPVGSHHGALDYVVTPLDWKVLRAAPCPVLISKSKSWQTGGAVLAAVDIANAKHDAINRVVLRTSVALCRLLGASLHVVCAYPDLGQSVNDYQVAMDYSGIKQDMHDTRDKALHEILRELGIDEAQVHLHEGKPSRVIKTVANHIDAIMTVVGTAARKSLGKIVFGNTSEDILSKLDCDVLTVNV
jgi:universal stress protein E